MNKLLTTIASVLFCIISITSLYANGIVFTGTAPTTNNSTVNNALESMFNRMLDDANNSFANVKNMPIFLRYMAAANTHVASAATQMNYLSYDLFAITLGTSFSEVGSGDNREIYRDMTTKGDMKTGEATQPWALQVGFNAGFLLDGLYFAAKFGRTSNSLTYGLLANYDLIKEQAIAEYVIWGGLKLGTGIIHQQYKINIPLDANIQYLPATVDGYTLRMLMRPDLLMKINSSAKVIPVELSTAIGIGTFNSFENPFDEIGCNVFSLFLTAGIGVDISHGRTKVDIKNKSLYTFEALGSPVASTITHGEVNVHSDIKEQRPHYFNPKMMLGLSCELLSVITDFSISIYFKDESFSANMSIGVTF
jgi:hypothetical protein